MRLWIARLFPENFFNVIGIQILGINDLVKMILWSAVTITLYGNLLFLRNKKPQSRKKY